MTWAVDPAYPETVGHCDPLSSEGEWDVKVADFVDADDAALAVLAVNERERLLAIVEAAREVDSYLSSGGPPFRFAKAAVSVDAETSLLVLHDELNSLDALRAGVSS